jgi:AcrR family transcriptional regulator
VDEDAAGSQPRTSRAARRAATQARILDAARQEFGDHGYEATTVRGVARRAGVDPSLVLQHYGSKSALFTAAIRLPPDAPEEAAEHLADVLKVRAAALPPEMRTLVRSMLTAPEASEAVRLHLDERIRNLAEGIGGPDAELRAAIAVSSILGLTLARHFLQLHAVSSASDDDLVRVASRAIAAGLGAERTRSSSREPRARDEQDEVAGTRKQHQDEEHSRPAAFLQN